MNATWNATTLICSIMPTRSSFPSRGDGSPVLIIDTNPLNIVQNPDHLKY